MNSIKMKTKEINCTYIHQKVLPKGRCSTANAETKVTVLSKGRSSTTNAGIKIVVLLGINRWGSFPHPTLFLSSEQAIKDLKRTQGRQR